MWELPVLSAQLFCKPEPAFKIYLKGEEDKKYLGRFLKNASKQIPSEMLI